MANKTRYQIEVGFSLDKAGLNELHNELDRITAEAMTGNSLDTQLKQAGKTASQLSDILDKAFNKNLGTLNVTKFNQELSKSNLTIKQVKADLEGAGNLGSHAYNLLGKSILGTNIQLKESSKLLNDMATSMANTVKWGITSSVFNNVTGAIQKAYYYSKDLDRSLNDIRIVTDKSAESMADFAVEANAAAKALGASTLDYTEASLIYYQQGLSEEEVRARSEVTLKAANVTGQTGEEVSEQLTAVWNGYKVTAEEAELYVDKLAAVAADTAADLEELSTGMSKVASAANSMGVDVDQLNAQLATIISVTRQAPESVGTALKTIYARLGDLSIDGEDEFGTSLGDVSGKMKQMGIDVVDQQGNLRDMGTVIDEVAAKWDTWTESQKQAAAVAMAGKRQYNNLIALFDNWDMYVDALNTSQNALGTLQQQQDIYLESTDAKLNQLRATTEDLYDGLIDNEELNVGIDALRNLIQVVDNFVDSFGGGIASISAFGAIISNVFNKQISSAIIRATNNQKKYNENVANLKLKREAIDAGTTFGSGPLTASQQSVKDNYDTQYEWAVKIQEARAGLSSEEYNILTAMQQQSGELQEQISYASTLNREQLTKSFSGEQNEDIKALFDAETLDIEKISKHYTKQFDTLSKTTEEHQKQFDIIKNSAKWIGKVEEDEADIQAIRKAAEQIGNRELKQLANDLEYGKSNQRVKSNILDLVKQISQEEQENLKTLTDQNQAIQNYKDKQAQINDIQGQKNMVDDEMTRHLELAQESVNITQRVTAVTSSLSGVATAWSAVNSMFQTWNDETATFGEKMFQTIITLGSAVGSLAMSYNQLNEAFGISTIFQKAVTEASQKDTIETGKQAVAEVAEAAATKQQAKANAEKVVTEQADNKAIDENIKKTSAQTVVQQGSTKSTLSLKKAWAGLSAVMTKFPVLGVIAGLTVLAGVVSGVTRAIHEHNQAQIEDNKTIIEEQRLLQSEAQEFEKLYQSYDKVYRAYKENKSTKEELNTATDTLIDKYDIENGKILQLSENYDALAESIKKARTTRLDEAREAAEKEYKAASENVLTTVKEEQGSQRGDRFRLGFSSTIFNDQEQEAMDIISDIAGGTERVSRMGDGKAIGLDFETGYNAEEILALYEKLVQAKEELEAQDLEDTRFYEDLDNWITSYEESAQNLLTAAENLKTSTLESAFEKAFNPESISSFETFEKQLEDVKTKANELYDYEPEELDDLVEDYVAKIDSEYSARFLAISELRKRFEENDPTKKYLETLEDEELNVLIGMHVTGDEASDEIKKILEAAKGTLSPEDTSIFVNLRTSVTDSKLNKTELEAYQENLSTLGSDFSLELNHFEDRSQLGQIDVLNLLTQKQVEANNDYLQSAREVAEARKKAASDALELAEVEKEELQIKRLTAELSEEDQARYDLVSAKVDILKTKVAEYQDVIENGLSLDAIDSTVFDNIYASVDGIVTKADALYNATAMIGEGWTVAAEDARKFIELYPEMLGEHKILADGSIQLNKDIVNSFIEGAQDELTANSEVYQEQVRQQIAIYEARIKFDKQKIEALEKYVQGEYTAEEAVAEVKKAGAVFEQSLNETLGVENTNLAQHQITNMELVKDNAIEELNAIGQAYSQLNEYAAKAIAGKAGEWGGISVSTQDTAAQEYTPKLGDAGFTNFMENEDFYRAAQEQLDQAKEQLVQDENTYNEYKKLLAELELSANNAAESINGVMTGKSGKTATTKSSGSKEQQDRMDALKEELDIYHDINNEITKYNNNLSLLQKRQDGLAGQDLINNLNEQLGNLNSQANAYQRKLALQKADLANQKAALQLQGVMFNGDDIANYNAIISMKTAEVNSLISIYNSLSGDVQKAYKDKVETAKKELELLTEAMEKYEDLLYNQVQDTQEQLEDIKDQMYEINLEKFTMEIELRLDVVDATRDFNNFKKKVIDQIKDDDILGNAKAQLQDFYTYYNDQNTGEIQALTKMVNNTLAELKKGDNGLFAGKEQEGLELLREYQEKLMTSMESLEDMIQDIRESYLELIDEVSEGLDEHIEKYNNISDILEHNANLIQLLYGDDAYALMGEYYDAQEKNNLANLDFQRQEVEFWKQQMDAADKNSEEWKKFYENYTEAQKSLNDLIESSLELVIEKYQNSIKEIMHAFDQEVTGGLGLEYIGEEWELITEKSDMYLDKIQQIYEAQKLANKITETINDNDLSVKAQEKLNKLYESQVVLLREKEKVTQYDVERANALYELALKEIALEEQQNNKTKMRLTRDSQGNWSYNYVADEDGVAEKEQELLDAQNSLYELDKEKYQENLNSIYDAYSEWQTKITELYLDTTLSAEEMEAKKQLYAEYYGDIINGLTAQNEEIKQNLTSSTFGMLGELYHQDTQNLIAMGEEQTAYILSMTEEFRHDYLDLEENIKTNYDNIKDKTSEVVSIMVPEWKSGVQSMADKFATGEDSFRGMCLRTYADLTMATQAYQYSLSLLEMAAGINFSNISNYINYATQATAQLYGANLTLIQSYQTQLAAMQSVLGTLNSLIGQYYAARDAAIAAASAAHQFYAAVTGANASANLGSAYGGGSYGGGSYSGYTPSSSSSSSSSGSGSGSGGRGNTGGGSTSSRNDLIDVGGGYYVNSSGQFVDNVGVHYGDSYDDWKKVLGSGFSTGGYTGSWGDEGKLALLHEKELVLNKEDTENVLAAVQAVRSMQGIVSALENSVMSTVAHKVNNLNAGANYSFVTDNKNEKTEQQVTIHAEFPNARNSSEIENAFNNLVNRATQYAHSQRNRTLE